jgi:hypothetical protein
MRVQHRLTPCRRVLRHSDRRRRAGFFTASKQGHDERQRLAALERQMDRLAEKAAAARDEVAGMTIKHCSFEGIPTLVSDTEAWSFSDGVWKEINAAEAGMGAAIIGEERFIKILGKLPPLPDTAFLRRLVEIGLKVKK